ncbi:MAG: bifunctional 4-hydroxy-2-oxoglutarate aldolase/2-dehydro-3-deoxy-phosphogluconate aldolase [Clostridiales Family XIII bacterium]|nr:bifunctional 4-hydroxy-2-oxoglutarate aldolase/2-dehydro-3-deoxy-phosphogluconate aldolase [Clostridiales Family XIII bacterium]
MGKTKETAKSVSGRIGQAGLVPVVVVDDSASALGAADALLAGGVPVMEITLRTEAGMDAIGIVCEKRERVLCGAGTVLSIDDCRKAVERGAAFIVSPGFDEEIVSWCLENGIAVFPGCVTPTEIARALKYGLDTLKFFPANVYGGAEALKALAAPFQSVRFMPTGGVDLSNLSEYVIPEVAAIGGGWLCPRKLLQKRDFESIEKACSESVARLASLRRPLPGRV